MFQFYIHFEYYFAAVTSSLAMLGMGMGLTPRDFFRVLRRPIAISVVLAAQYVLMPLAALSIGMLLDLPAGVALGLIFASVLPSGTSSNILAYLGGGNLPLSIAATTASTLLCLLLTPTMLRLLAADQLPAAVEMPAGRIALEIMFYLLIPLALGMLIGRGLGKSQAQAARWVIRASLVGLACIVVGSLSSGRIDVTQFGWLVPVLIIAFAVASLLISQWTTLAIGFGRPNAVTMGIEISVRNANIGVVLAASIFPATAEHLAEIGGGVMFVVLFYGGATLVAPLVAIWFDRTFIYGPPSRQPLDESQPTEK